MKPFGFFGKTSKTGGGLCARKLADCRGTAFGVGIEIESLIRPPCMARDPLGLVQTDMAFSARSGRRKHLVDHRAHCEYCRSGINLRAAHTKLSNLAAWAIFLFDHRYRNPTRRQQNGADKAADTGPDNDGLSAVRNDLAPLS